MTEVVIPSFSLAALLSVTVYISLQSITVLSAPAEQQRNVNVAYLFGFTTANFVIDALSSYLFCFKGGREAFTHHHHDTDDTNSGKSNSNSSGNKTGGNCSVKEIDLLDDVIKSGLHDVEAPLPQHPLPQQQLEDYPITITVESTADTTTSSQQQTKEQGVVEATVVTRKSNINMISAVTHLGGDSLRTVAVFVAAMVAQLTGARSDLCDAWAAIIVSFTIVLLAVPLLVEIRKAFSRLLMEKEKERERERGVDVN
jgi:Co/Zn/Cd efflux system component